MGDPREYEFSEKTEPFSQSEIEERMLRSRMGNVDTVSDAAISLDRLVVPPDEDIRILVRPLTRSRSVSPGNQENCKWLALHAEVAEEERSQHKVLAVTQTSRDIKFSVRIPAEQLENASPRPPLWCELYYDPASDNQILVNRSHVPFTLSRVSATPLGSPGEEYDVNPNFNKALTPGTWRIKFNEFEVLDFRILEKRPARLRLMSSDSDVSTLTDGGNSSGKRSFVADDDEVLSPGKRHRLSDADGKGDDGVIMFLPAKKNPLVLPLPHAETGKELAAANGHPLLDMESGEMVEISGGCELDEYALVKRDAIASTSLSSVFTAEHSNIPDGVIVVKVLKTRSAAVTNPAAEARNVIHQADVWLRELRFQEDLQHKGIVRLYGGDARYLSLYMEHIEARDLQSRGTWRSASTDLFTGDRSDAVCIMRDIASALHYMHTKKLVHNDIKPANILYSRERGAVLCDLGLSTHVRDPASTGGTPWYVPPEFIALKQRGEASDVWALGIVMLYVLRKITFPDARANRNHPQHIHWFIAKVNPHPRDRNPQPEAVLRMRQWLREMNLVRAGLNTQDKLERLVYDMLWPNPHQRVTMKEIVNQLYSDQISDK